MKSKINYPQVAIKLSQKAYREASKQYNEKKEKEFNAGETPKGKTLSSFELKDTHFQLFYILINYYNEKLDNISRFLQGSSNISTYTSPKLSMYVKTGRLASHFNRANNTIRARLRRLEDAGIIKVVFHGNKKPLEVIFDKNTCLIYDKNNLEYTPKSKFLTLSNSVLLNGIGIKANNKRVLSKELYNNNTITQSDVLHISVKTVDALQNAMQNKSFYTINNKRTTQKTGTKQADRTEKAEFSATVRKERKKVPQKKERTIIDIRNERLEKARLKAKLSAMTVQEKADYYTKLKEEQRKVKVEELKKKRKDAIVGFSLMFFGYLVETLFKDKYLSPEYRKQTLNYIAKHYFAPARSIEVMKGLWHNNYKKRIDISKDWIDKFERPDGSGFDTTFFYPKAYLDVERRGKGILSFANTEKFLKQSKEWEKKNGYNRRSDDDGRHKLNKIARELENGFINYDTALEKVKSITQDTDEYIKQLNARVFGIYSSMQKND